MRTMSVQGALIAAATIGLAVGAGRADDAAQFVMPPGSGVGDADAESLSEQWWMWAMSIPEPVNPVRDRTGRYCRVGQSGDVWFLAGGFGSSLINRTCTVPQGKYLFFPAINNAFWGSRDSDMTCDEARASAAVHNDSEVDVFVTLNGVPVADANAYRVRSTDCFNVFERIADRAGAWDAYPTASDGYWFAVRPLPAGEHKLSFGGMYRRDDTGSSMDRMLQDIEYTIIVE